MMRGGWRGAALAAALVAAVVGPLAAQDTTRARPPAPADTDSVPPPRALPVNGLLMHPQHLRYEMTVVTPDSVHRVGMRDVLVQRSSYGAFPAWLVTETRSGSVPSVDSVYLSYVDLRPLHWTSVIGGRARMGIEFTADSLYGATSGPSGDQTIVLAHGRDLLAGRAMTDVVLELMPHTVGRVDSVTVLVLDLGSNRILPGALSVDGEQDVPFAPGTVHCWVVSLTTPEGVVRYWVSETDPAVVEARQALPGAPGQVFTEKLVSRQ